MLCWFVADESWIASVDVVVLCVVVMWEPEGTRRYLEAGVSVCSW
jgi:hypothetical protein